MIQNPSNNTSSSIDKVTEYLPQVGKYPPLSRENMGTRNIKNTDDPGPRESMCLGTGRLVTVDVS